MIIFNLGESAHFFRFLGNIQTKLKKELIKADGHLCL